MLLIASGIAIGFVFGQASRNDAHVADINELRDAYEERIDYCDTHISRVTNNSAYFRLRERTSILYRIVEAADRDSSYETLMLDIGSGYRGLLDRASRNMPEELNEGDAMEMDLARGMADRLRDMAQERARRYTNQETP